MQKLIFSAIVISILVIASVACGSDNESNETVGSLEPQAVEEAVTTDTSTTSTTSTTIEIQVEEVVPEYVEPVYEEPAYVEPVYEEPVYYEPPPAVEVPAGSIEEIICSVFGDQCQKALSVAWCESNYNPNVVGAAGERGLMQIHPVHINNLPAYGLTWDSMFDPYSNLQYAYALYSSQGWSPWTCA
jgi:hypothetical protein